jgi:hypothetical protein
VIILDAVVGVSSPHKHSLSALASSGWQPTSSSPSTGAVLAENQASCPRLPVWTKIFSSAYNHPGQEALLLACRGPPNGKQRDQTILRTAL